MTRENVVGALLLVGLAASSVILVFTSSFVRSPSSRANQQPGGAPPADNATGLLRLVVNVVGLTPQSTLQVVAGYPGGLGTPPAVFAAPPTFLSNGSALLPVNFTIVGVGLSQPPIHLVMPQPGEAEVKAQAGFYTLSTRNEYYNLSASALVNARSVTEVDVNVTESTMPAAFSVVPDTDGSGVVPPWGPITVEVVGSSTTPSRGSTVFLEFGGSPSPCSPQCPEAASGKVLSRVVQSDPRETGLWLVVSPEKSLRTASLGNLALLTFEVSYKVESLGS